LILDLFQKRIGYINSIGVIILNLKMDGKTAEQYASNAQKIRVITET